MQNKPNLTLSKTAATFALTRDYKNMQIDRPQNKPNLTWFTQIILKRCEKMQKNMIKREKVGKTVKFQVFYKIVRPIRPINI